MNHTMHGIIFSYGKPTGLGDLIAHRIPGSMPFGGNYRVVDFMLSNMVNAGIHDVGVIMHGKCQSMLDHLGNGRSWDLSRNRGGLTLLPAFAYAESRTSAGRFRGKVEALGCVLEYLREIRQEYVVLADSDLVINLPLEQVLQEHIASGADLTEVCTAEPGNPSDTYLELDEQGRIVDVASFLEDYPCDPDGGTLCIELEIEDSLLPWNDRTFNVRFADGHCTMTREPAEYHLKMGIGTFTTLLLGYKTAERLYELERIEGREEAVERLDDVLFHKIPYISDYI